MSINSVLLSVHAACMGAQTQLCTDDAVRSGLFAHGRRPCQHTCSADATEVVTSTQNQDFLIYIPVDVTLGTILQCVRYFNKC